MSGWHRYSPGGASYGDAPTSPVCSVSRDARVRSVEDVPRARPVARLDVLAVTARETVVRVVERGELRGRAVRTRARERVVRAVHASVGPVEHVRRVVSGDDLDVADDAGEALVRRAHERRLLGGRRADDGEERDRRGEGGAPPHRARAGTTGARAKLNLMHFGFSALRLVWFPPVRSRSVDARRSIEIAGRESERFDRL
eukprot:31387-Pelagococcus_subviridis.AAC.20